MQGNNLLTELHIFVFIPKTAAVLVRKEEKDLLSLISTGMEFQRNDPSYTKLVRGC